MRDGYRATPIRCPPRAGQGIPSLWARAAPDILPGGGAPLARKHSKDPRDEPAYLVQEAAHHLGLPSSTVRAWAMGQNHPSGRMLPLITPAQASPPTLSFWNLVEVYVLATIRRRHHVSMQKVRKAVWYVQRRLSKGRPLIEQEFLTDGVGLFVEEFARLIDVSDAGQVVLQEVLEASLQRIDRDPQGLAERFYPWLKDPMTEPRHVVIDPQRSFGRPVLRGTGIPTEILAERFRGGDSVGSLAQDYKLSAIQVETALRWESCAAAAA